VLRRRGADIPLFMDAAAPGLLVAQAIGRVGNYFNQELFGGPTSLPWGLQIDAAHRPIGYGHYATFHPTFLYELIWNLALAGALVWLGRRSRIRAPGLFALYVAGYSGFRIFEELLRVDPAHHILGLRLNSYVATLLLAAGVIWFARIERAGRQTTSVASRADRRRSAWPGLDRIRPRRLRAQPASSGVAGRCVIHHPARRHASRRADVRSRTDGRRRQKGDETPPIPRIARKSTQIAKFCVLRMCCENRLVSRDFGGLDSPDVTTENRGVPGSSPGLATRKPAWVLEFLFVGSGARRQAALELG
jgi:hypothetical protein